MLQSSEIDQITFAVEENMAELISCCDPDLAKQIFTHLLEVKLDEAKDLPVIEKYLNEMNIFIKEAREHAEQQARERAEQQERERLEQQGHIQNWQQPPRRSARQAANANPTSEANKKPVTAPTTPESILKTLLGVHFDDKKLTKTKILEIALLNLVLLLKKPYCSSYLYSLKGEYEAIQLHEKIENKLLELEKKKDKLQQNEIDDLKKEIDKLKNVPSIKTKSSIDQLKNEIDELKKELPGKQKSFTGKLSQAKIMINAKLKHFNPSEDNNNLRKALEKQKEEQHRLVTLNQELQHQLQELQNSPNLKALEEIEKIKTTLKDTQLKLSATNLMSNDHENKNKLLDGENQTLRKQLEKYNLEEKILRAKIQSLELEANQKNIPVQIENFYLNDSVESAKKTKKTPLSVGAAAKEIILHLLRKYSFKFEESPLKSLLATKHGICDELYTQAAVSANRIPLTDFEVLAELVWFYKKYKSNENFNITTNNGWTLMAIAAYFDDPITLRKMPASANPSCKKTDDGFDALSIAIILGNDNVVPPLLSRLLKFYKTSTNFLTQKKYHYNNLNVSIIDLAVQLNRVNVFEILLNSAKLSPYDFSEYISLVLIDNNIELLKILLEVGKRQNITTGNFLTKFIPMADNIAVLKLLLLNGANLSLNTLPRFIKDNELLASNLHFACAEGDIELCKKYLLDFNNPSEKNLTQCLAIAMVKGYLPIAAMILDHLELRTISLDLNKFSKFIFNSPNITTCLQMLMNRRIWDYFVSEQIRTFITELRKQNKGDEAIAVLQKDSRLERFLNENLIKSLKDEIINNVAELQIAKKITPELKSALTCDPMNENPLLFYAVSHNKLIITRKLFEIGQDVNLLLTNCETALHIAVKNSHYDMIQLLIQSGANVTLRSLGGIPLTYALEKSDVNSIKMLTDNKLTKEEQIVESIRYSLESAIKKDNIQHILLIITNCPLNLVTKAFNNKLLMILIARNKPNIIHHLLVLNLPWTTRGNQNISPADLICYVGNKDLLFVIQQNYVARLPHWTVFDAFPSKDEAAFLLALDNGKLEEVKTFINVKGFNVNHYFKSRDMNPLMIAALKGYTEIVKFLISKDASLESINAHNLQPINFAEMGDHSEIINLINKQLKRIPDNDSIDSLLDSDSLDAFSNISMLGNFSSFTDLLRSGSNNSFLSSASSSPKRKTLEDGFDIDDNDENNKQRKLGQ